MNDESSVFTPAATSTERAGLGRRAVILGGAGALGAAVLGSRLSFGSAAAMPRVVTPRAVTPGTPKTVHLAGTDGWVSMPAGSPPDLPFYPDSLAPDLLDTYVFGFRDVTGFSDAQVAATRGKAQISAPMLAFDEGDDVTHHPDEPRPAPCGPTSSTATPSTGTGSSTPSRSSTVCPSCRSSVPIGRNLSYFYRPHDAGTYMYHCHFEDVEHVQMGMTGMVFVRPKQNGTAVGTSRRAP